MKYMRIFILLASVLLTCCSGNDDPEVEPEYICPENDQVYQELLLSDTETSIECTFDCIDFTFCLLNEEGVPATKFKEGENFSFHFKITNNRKDELYVDASLSGFFCNPDRGNVNTSDTTIKFPRILTCLAVGHKHPFFDDSRSIETNLPWVDGEPKVHIPKGKYYTEFTHSFEFFIEIGWTPIVSVGPLTFKINFEIE